MTTQHTQGRLKLSFGKNYQWAYMINSAEGTPIAYFGHHKPMTVKEGKANARRLVACWNRLEKFTTEQIEDLGYDLFADVRPDFERVMRERDELLEALKRIEGATMSMYATRSAMLDDCKEIARAAIAKVKEKS